MENRVKFWKLDELPGVEHAAEMLDKAVEHAIEALNSELAAGADKFVAFRVAYGVVWWQLAQQARYGAHSTEARETAWTVLFERTAPLLGYEDPEVLCDDVCQWDRFYW